MALITTITRRYQRPPRVGRSTLGRRRYPVPVFNLLLVRHATSQAPSAGGADEYRRPLTAEGLRQAYELSDVLSSFAPARFLSSPYLRAIQTVVPAARSLGLEVELREEVREWTSGIEPTPEWRRHYRYCWENPLWSIAEGESHDALKARALGALEQAADEAGGCVTVIGSHGTWIASALLGLGCDVDADFWFAMPMPAVYSLQLDGGLPTVVEGPGLS